MDVALEPIRIKEWTIWLAPECVDPDALDNNGTDNDDNTQWKRMEAVAAIAVDQKRQINIQNSIQSKNIVWLHTLRLAGHWWRLKGGGLEPGLCQGVGGRETSTDGSTDGKTI